MIRLFSVTNLFLSIFVKKNFLSNFYAEKIKEKSAKCVCVSASESEVAELPHSDSLKVRLLWWVIRVKAKSWEMIEIETLIDGSDRR